MRNSIVYCFLGAVAGAVIIASTHSVWHQGSDKIGEPVANTATSTIVPQDDRVLTKSKPVERKANAPNQGPRVESDNVTELATVTQTDANDGTPVDQAGREISENYVAMVTPRPLPEKLTTQEMYKEFLEDSRDESWAYPMELGIGQYIAERGGDFGAAFEYVECRSRYCTIAGVVYGGGQPTVNEFMAEMTGSGWWQAYGGNNTVGSRTDDEYRFVSIFPRTPDDFSRDSSGQSVGKSEDSAVKSVGG